MRVEIVLAMHKESNILLLRNTFQYDTALQPIKHSAKSYGWLNTVFIYMRNYT